MSETTSSLTNNLSVPFAPRLDPEFQARLHLLVCEIALASKDNQVKGLDLAVQEVKREQACLRQENRKEAADRFTAFKAALMLLRDLLQLGWVMQLEGSNIHLLQTPLDDKVDNARRQVKASMRFERIESLHTSAVRDFIRYMERPRLVQGTPQNVLSLVADGSSLGPLVDQAAALSPDNAVSLLLDTVRPYLQLVTKDQRDIFTGLRLTDIWRYFRLSWSTPFRSTPGRNLFYLVRDAGQPCHPIMGIAALANCVIGLKCRDDQIGWTPEALIARLRKAKEVGEEHFKAVAWEEARLLEHHLDVGIKAIALDGIATQNTVLYPTEEAVADLHAMAATAAAERFTHLQNEATQQDTRTFEEHFEFATPEGIKVGQSREQRASSLALFRRKRATKLASLLQAKLMCQRHDVFTNAPDGLPRLLWSNRDWSQHSEAGRSAIRVIMHANKDSKIGSAMMEVTVCGAIPPYNHLLAGKLVAMLLSSSQVIQDYASRYGELASTIASQVAGHPVTRPAHLVYLGTTSLYVGSTDKARFDAIDERRIKEDWRAFEEPVRLSSSSQYNRIHIPGNILGQDDAIVYKSLGVTKGFGVVHFSDETRQALEELDFLHLGGKRVNSLFGEGTSPRMRKIRQGLNLLGLDGKFLVHGHSRLVYGIELARNAKHYLNGQDASPDYLWPIDDPQRVTEAISHYWIERWLVSRLRHMPARDRVRTFRSTQAAASREIEADIPQETQGQLL